MSISFRPAVREKTPLIIGVSGPTKSGKTLSALRLAKGLAGGGTVAMINAEGPRGHQYADKFSYVACELNPPFRPQAYTDALKAATDLKPAVVIIDSVSQMHDGPGGVLEWHEEILDRMAGNDQAKRQRATFTAWVEPKASENQFIYTMLSMKCPVILCLRAKEKIKIVPGKQPVDLGWQPIVGERIAFETIFTLMLPPHSKGVPDLSISDMREPFDSMVPVGKQLDERLGEQLAAWASGAAGQAEVKERPAAAAGPGGNAPASATRPAVSDAKGKAAIVAKVAGAAEAKGWSARELLKLLLGRDVRSSKDLTDTDLATLNDLTADALYARMDEALAGAVAE